MSREELIASWEFSWASGFKCVPTPVGIELFLWANGHGRRPIEFFYSRHFTPVDIPTEQVPIYAGRSISVVDDDGEQAEFNGFDYAVHSNGLHYCKVPPKDEVENEPTRN